jgi:hypothetical protein
VKEDLIVMFQTGRTTSAQEQDIIVCIPKKNAPTQVKDYRPLTLLNADYEIYARVLANRMKLTLHRVLHPNQFSCAQRRTIFDARSPRHYSVLHPVPRGLCLLALDFAQAFDEVSHEYLFGRLERYAYSTKTRGAVSSLCTEARQCVCINGHMSDGLTTGCSVRHGCPVSMLLYALALNPLLTLLDTHLRGVDIGPRRHKYTSAAYADDVTVILTDMAEVEILDRKIRNYEKSAGVRINWEKFHALPVGEWLYPVQY